MLHFGAHLAQKGLIEEPGYVNVLLGSLGTSPVSPAALAAFQSVMPSGWTWSVGGVGRQQLDATLLGIAAGGGVRVGLEDNIWADRGRTDSARTLRPWSGLSASPSSPSVRSPRRRRCGSGWGSRHARSVISATAPCRALARPRCPDAGPRRS